MTKALTAAAIKKIRATSKRLEIPDGGCRGLHLVVQTSGSKSWALRYRRPDKRPAKLHLGTVYDPDEGEPETPPIIGGHLTLAAAHRLVGELRHQIAQGRDPGAIHMASRQRNRAASEDRARNTFDIAARDFVEQYASKKTRRWQEQARLLGVLPADLSFIPKGLSERWRKRPVAEIDSHDIHALIEETRQIGAPGLTRRGNHPTEARARAMLSCLSRMFRWLQQHRRIAENPCAGVHRPETPKARERFLTDAEIIKFWAASDAERNEFGTVLKLLLLTGCRLNEIAKMTPSELSEDFAVWNIPGSRTKNKRPHAVPLSTAARDLIVPTLTSVEPSSFIFSTTCGTSPVSGWSKIKSRLDKRMAVPHWRLHDLRRTAATGMAEIGIAPHIVEAVLNHVSGAKAGVAGVYNRAAYSTEKRAALEGWARHVNGVVSRHPPKIVALRKRT
jgi:integrase